MKVQLFHGSLCNGRLLIVGLAAAAAYLLAYCLLMTRAVPAQVRPGVKAFGSSSRFAELYVEDVNGVHEYYPGPTFANYVFWPIDYVLDTVLSGTNGLN